MFLSPHQEIGRRRVLKSNHPPPVLTDIRSTHQPLKSDTDWLFQDDFGTLLEYTLFNFQAKIVVQEESYLRCIFSERQPALLFP